MGDQNLRLSGHHGIGGFWFNQGRGPPPPAHQNHPQPPFEQIVIHVNPHHLAAGINGEDEDNGEGNENDDGDDSEGLVIDDRGIGGSDQDDSGSEDGDGGDNEEEEDPVVELRIIDGLELGAEAEVLAGPIAQEMVEAQGDIEAEAAAGPQEIQARPGSRNNDDDDLGFPTASAALLISYLNSPLLSDVRFTTGPENNRVTFYGHKIIYAIKSAFLRHAFEQLEPPINEVRLERTNPSTFTYFSDYIYENHRAVTTHFGPLEKGGLELIPLLKLGHFANHYQVPPLVERCSSTIMDRLRNFDGRKLFMIWKFMLLALPNSSAMRFIEEYLDRHANSLIQTEEFLQLGQHYLIRILSRDTLQVSDEVDLFIVAVRWAKFHLRRRGVFPNRQQIRDQLGVALHQIRFTTMEINTFKRVVLPQDVLTEHEVTNILQCLKSNGNPARRSCPPFNTRRRTLIPSSGGPAPAAVPPPLREQVPVAPRGNAAAAAVPPPLREQVPVGPRGNAAAAAPGPIAAAFRSAAPIPAEMPMQIADPVPLDMSVARPQCIMHDYYIQLQLESAAIFGPGTPSYFRQVFMDQLRPRIEHYCQQHRHLH